MFTQSHLVTRTLQQVLMAILVLAAAVLLLPDRSEAAGGAAARRGRRPLAVQAHRCSLAPVVTARHVVVQSVGRQRIVVRNEMPSARHGAALSPCSYAGCGRIWVPGHHERRANRHGRLRKVWIPGRWT
jgi:hypothetical protein